MWPRWTTSRYPASVWLITRWNYLNFALSSWIISSNFNIFSSWGALTQSSSLLSCTEPSGMCFLAVHNSSIGDLVTQSVTHFTFAIQRAILETCDNFWKLTTILTTQTIAFAILTIEKTILETCDIWDTDYNSDNLCYLTINCDTGQHSQFLRCFWPGHVSKITNLFRHSLTVHGNLKVWPTIPLTGVGWLEENRNQKTEIKKLKTESRKQKNRKQKTNGWALPGFECVHKPEEAAGRPEHLHHLVQICNTPQSFLWETNICASELLLPSLQLIIDFLAPSP